MSVPEKVSVLFSNRDTPSEERWQALLPAEFSAAGHTKDGRKVIAAGLHSPGSIR